MGWRLVVLTVAPNLSGYSVSSRFTSAARPTPLGPVSTMMRGGLRSGLLRRMRQQLAMAGASAGCGEGGGSLQVEEGGNVCQGCGVCRVGSNRDKTNYTLVLPHGRYCRMRQAPEHTPVQGTAEGTITPTPASTNPLTCGRGKAHPGPPSASCSLSNSAPLPALHPVSGSSRSSWVHPVSICSAATCKQDQEEEGGRTRVREGWQLWDKAVQVNDA